MGVKNESRVGNENMVDYENNITTVTIEKPTRALISEFIRGEERVGECLHRILTEYKKLKNPLPVES